MNETLQQYNQALDTCRDIFLKKTIDYGTSWRVLRPISILDQLFIKAQRIRTVQELGVQKVDEDITGEFRAMVNYGIIGLIQLHLKAESVEELPVTEAEENFILQAGVVRQIMIAKNHDYGEAWREMSQEGFVDLILMKLLRIRQILANNGKTLISEGIDSNFVDIINYSLFALILIGEKKHSG